MKHFKYAKMIQKIIYFLRFYLCIDFSCDFIEYAHFKIPLVLLFIPHSFAPDGWADLHIKKEKASIEIIGKPQKPLLVLTNALL
jgi:hypothetical protein